MKNIRVLFVLQILISCFVVVYGECEPPPGKDKPFKVREWTYDGCPNSRPRGSATCTASGWVGMWCGIELRGVVSISEALKGNARRNFCDPPTDPGFEYLANEIIKKGDELEINCPSGAVTVKTCSENGNWVGLDCDTQPSQIQGQSSGFLMSGSGGQPATTQRNLVGGGGECIAPPNTPFAGTKYRTSESFTIPCSGGSGTQTATCLMTGQWKYELCVDTQANNNRGFFLSGLFGGGSNNNQNTGSSQFVIGTSNRYTPNCVPPAELGEKIRALVIRPGDGLLLDCPLGSYSKTYKVTCQPNGGWLREGDCGPPPPPQNTGGGFLNIFG